MDSLSCSLALKFHVCRFSVIRNFPVTTIQILISPNSYFDIEKLPSTRCREKSVRLFMFPLRSVEWSKKTCERTNSGNWSIHIPDYQRLSSPHRQRWTWPSENRTELRITVHQSGAFSGRSVKAGDDRRSRGPEMGGEIWKGKREGVDERVYYVAGLCCDCLDAIFYSGGSASLDGPLSAAPAAAPPALVSRNAAMNSGIGGSGRWLWTQDRPFFMAAETL